MLEIKQKHSIHLPHLELPRHMELSPVPISDDDELSLAINNDPAQRDDIWQLSERPEIGALTEFWEKVQEDIRQDPEWFSFNDD